MKDAIAIARLLRGDPASAVDTASLTALWDVLARAIILANGNGRVDAFESFLSGRADADTLRKAVFAVDPDEPETKDHSRMEATFGVDVPPLPDDARLPANRGQDASPWLDEYIAFSREWSPRAFEGFHEAGGLFVLSTIGARRIALHLGRPRYTNLYIALIARTSLYVKSTTAEIATATLKAAGLDWLLAADDSTPQKFIQDLTLRVPDNFNTMTPEQQERDKLRLALTAQRGWFYEEFGQHLDAMNHEGGVMAAFRGMLKRFDDCRDRFEYATISRGNDVVERPYLALLVNLTPADMKPLAKLGSAMWNDGFWARFAFVVPHANNISRARFPKGERIIPTNLIKPLREWHERLGVPDISIDDELDAKGNPTGKKRVSVQPLQVATCTFADEVFEAFYRYHDGLLEIVAKSDNTDLDGNYARFAEKALRISMLLASLENNNQIEIRHWARGQEITERWRMNLHALIEQVNQADPSKEKQDEARMLWIVQKLGTPTAAEVARYVRGMSSAETVLLLEGLVKAGALKSQQTGRATRYEVVQDEP
jgi:Protein of unknown function (DUF3987)